MDDKIRFDDEDHDGLYELTDSEAGYSEEEKELLQKVRQGNRRESNAKQEVLAFDEDSTVDEDDEEEEEDDVDDDDGDDDISELMRASDIEGATDDEEADIPDRKAWGRRARDFYNTDYVDPDWGTLTEKERQLALAEEEEAMAIQKRLTAEIKEENFHFNSMSERSSDDEEEEEKIAKKTKADDKEGGITVITTDIDGLSPREKAKYFQADSPEFYGLTEDLKWALMECRSLLVPVLNYVKAKNMPRIPALEFAQMMQTLLLTYCSNINFYLMLKANRTAIRHHPVISRMLQLKEMIDKLNGRYENIIKPQLEALLQRIEDGDVFEIIVNEEQPRPKKRQRTKSSIGKDNLAELVDDIASIASPVMSDEDMDAVAGEDSAENFALLASAEEIERRGITYEIAKNKGLMPRRKKELRNPRVNHRNKFRKALIRRKGAVREVRKETKRYGGEISGIKTTVSKSVKFA